MKNIERGFNNLENGINYEVRLMLEEAPEQTDKDAYASFLKERKK